MLENDRRRRELGERSMIFFGLVFFMAGFVWLWWHWVPVLYEGYNGISQAERLTAITNTRTALLAGLVGIGALGTFWLNSRVYRITARTFAVTERGHQTDRYAKAIEQLGDDKLDVRLGGIYALEQLAADSENPRDQATIVEVLSAFVRIRSQKVAQEAEPNRPPDDDVQAAITVLSRLPSKFGAKRADLHGAYLRRAIMAAGEMVYSLREGELRVWFWGSAEHAIPSDFTRANFAGADLGGAFLIRAKLRESRFLGTNLAGAHLSGTDLSDARFERCDLTGAHLDYATLSGTRFDQTTTTRTQLFGADLSTTQIAQEQLDAAEGDSNTKLPTDGSLVRPQHWREVSSTERPEETTSWGPQLGPPAPPPWRTGSESEEVLAQPAEPPSKDDPGNGS